MNQCIMWFLPAWRCRFCYTRLLAPERLIHMDWFILIIWTVSDQVMYFTCNQIVAPCKSRVCDWHSDRCMLFGGLGCAASFKAKVAMRPNVNWFARIIIFSIWWIVFRCNCDCYDGCRAVNMLLEGTGFHLLGVWNMGDFCLFATKDY